MLRSQIAPMSGLDWDADEEDVWISPDGRYLIASVFCNSRAFHGGPFYVLWDVHAYKPVTSMRRSAAQLYDYWVAEFSP